jgi:hypothetical protein
MALWDGSAWSQDSIPFPKAAQSTRLVSVSCPSVTLCWAVGYYATASKSLPYDLEWNGTAWSAVTLPHRAGSHFYPYSVSCSSPTDCWAAQNDGGNPPLAHWDGTAWTMVAAPGLAPAFGPDLSCVSANDCWMVGPHKSRGSTWAARWDGNSWSMVRLPTSNLGSRGLDSISCVATACMTVGRDAGAGFPKGPSPSTGTARPGGS